MNATSVRVRQCVSEAADGFPWDQIVDAQVLAELGIDSLERIELLMSIESEFRIQFSEADDTRLTSTTTTVLDLVQAVEEFTRKGASALPANSSAPSTRSAQ